MIANNAVYSAQGNAIRVAGALGQVTVVGNVGEGSLSGVSSGLASGNLANDFLGASYSGTVPNDVFPKPGSQLIGAGDAQYVVADDFNGTSRGGVVDVGAYKFDASGNPGWTLAAGFKDETPVTGTGGGGGGTSGGGGTGVGGGSGGGAAASGGASSGGSSASGASGDDGGCSCGIASPVPMSGWLALALAAFGGLVRRRLR